MNPRAKRPPVRSWCATSRLLCCNSAGKIISAGKGMSDMDIQSLHGVRLRAKRARYAAEIFAVANEGKPAERFIRRLSALQQRLGVLNDGAVAAQLLQKFEGPSGRHAYAVGIVVGFTASRAERIRPRIIRAFDKFGASRLIGLDCPRPCPASHLTEVMLPSLVVPGRAAASRRPRCKELAVSLNNKRRIFRPEVGLLPRLGAALPASGMLLTAACGIASILTAAWLLFASNDAPAGKPSTQRVSALADHLEVIDGHTLLVAGHLLHLRGIMAPARGSVCQPAANANADCGVMAANALASLVRRARLDCTVEGQDEVGRPTADCFVGGIALSVAMVRGGWARAQAGHADLRQAEAEAKAADKGIWHSP
jgi:endonuclease YncB( thermonuclease family)